MIKCISVKKPTENQMATSGYILQNIDDAYDVNLIIYIK
jgi:hypothetical protein